MATRDEPSRHRGSCHCGAVQLECAIDWSRGTSRCNCSICTKARFWKVVVPARDFRLVSGAEHLTEYRFGSRSIGHFFCRICGVKTFGRGEHEALGGTFYAINVACLDDLAPSELASLPIRYEDGRADRWEEPPAETRYL